MSDHETTTVEEAPVPMPKRGKKKEATPAPTEFIQLFSREDGSVLFTSKVLKGTHYYRSENDKILAAHLPDILRDAIEHDIDISKVTLADTNLAGVNFRNMNLSGIDFSNCNLNETDFRGCTLVGCNFDDCAFDSTRMTNADITGANITDCNFAHIEARHVIGLIMVGELNDYYVYGYPRPTGVVYPNGQKEVELRIKAGCRDFSLPQARNHWSVDNKDSIPVQGREEIWAALPLLEIIARNKGWRTSDEPMEPVDTDPNRGDPELEEDEDE